MLHSLGTEDVRDCLVFCSVLQGEGGDGGSGGESPAAADGDHSGDAGGPARGQHGCREEDPGRLGRYMNTAHSGMKKRITFHPQEHILL